MAVSAADLEHAIKGIDFPASKDELVKQASHNNADDTIVAVIKDLPKQKFKSPIEVSKAFGKEKRH
jgi:hypothetical protein